MDGLFTKGVQYELYVGLKDKDSYEEIITVDEFKDILRGICTTHDACFSLLTQFGGYNHNKGYTTENSLRVVIVGADEDQMLRLAAALKKRINTDTVLLTRTEIEYAFI